MRTMQIIEKSGNNFQDHELEVVREREREMAHLEMITNKYSMFTVQSQGDEGLRLLGLCTLIDQHKRELQIRQDVTSCTYTGCTHHLRATNTTESGEGERGIG